MSDDYRVEVQIKGGDDVQGPWQSREDAQLDLQAITDVLGASNPRRAMLGVPKVAWMSAQGQNIKAAALKQRPAPPRLA